MEKEKNIKFFLGFCYVLIISLFLWVFFENYTLQEITSFEFIKNNRDKIIELKNNNYFIIFIIFFIITIIWVLLLGFALPICLLGGFIFGKWFGTIIVVFGLTSGATILYIIANYFFKELIKQQFYSRFNYLTNKFKKNEFIYFLIYRFVGGIPFSISNILPSLFNVKIKSFFIGSLIGMTPQLFIWVSVGSGLEKIINQYQELPSIINLVLFPDIYIPLLLFVFLTIVVIILKKKIFTDN